MLEINPLIVDQGRSACKCLDAKVSFDSQRALPPPRRWLELRDDTRGGRQGDRGVQVRPRLYRRSTAPSAAWSTAPACAMATLDIIKLYGKAPANFLDVGGGASEEKVTAAFKIITADPKVKGILVNIFGGIMKCDVIARGVIAAVKAVGLQVPLVVRLEGTNVEEGKQIIRDSGLNVHARRRSRRCRAEDRQRAVKA